MQDSDQDYVPQTENSTDTESSGSPGSLGSSVLSEAPNVLYHVPSCIFSILNGRRQFSFGDVPLCKQALAQIAAHLKACHSEFWGLQGNGECATCAKIERENYERALKEAEQRDIEMSS